VAVFAGAALLASAAAFAQDESAAEPETTTITIKALDSMETVGAKGQERTVLTGGVEIVVISRHHEPNDLNCFLSLGIDPTRRRYLMLKSRIHYRAGFSDIARDIFECAGTGVCTSDYDMLDFRNVRRPIYPLDRINEP
jgi:microcystin degradation protein MlrC